MNRKTGFLSILGSAFVLSSVGLFIRMLKGSFGVYTQVGVRALVIVLILVVWLYLRRTSLKLPGVNKRVLGAYALASAFTTIFYTVSVLNTKVANSIFYLYIGLFFGGFLLGRLFFGEVFTKSKLIALGLALIGLFLFAYPLSGSLTSVGVLCGLGAGLTESISKAAAKKMGSTVKRKVLLTYRFATGACVALGIAMLTKEKMIGQVGVISIVALLVIAGIYILIGEAVIYGFNNFDLDLGTIVASSELAFGIVIGVLFLGENPSTLEILGAGMLAISLATIQISFWWARRRKPEAIIR